MLGCSAKLWSHDCRILQTCNSVAKCLKRGHMTTGCGGIVGTLNPGHRYFQVDPLELQTVPGQLVISRGLPILCPFSSAFMCSFREFFSQKFL